MSIFAPCLAESCCNPGTCQSQVKCVYLTPALDVYQKEHCPFISGQRKWERNNPPPSQPTPPPNLEPQPHFICPPYSPLKPHALSCFQSIYIISALSLSCPPMHSTKPPFSQFLPHPHSRMPFRLTSLAPLTSVPSFGPALNAGGWECLYPALFFSSLGDL